MVEICTGEEIYTEEKSEHRQSNGNLKRDSREAASGLL
jgi:hypothetical protein